MIEGIDAITVAAGLGGAVVGALLRHVLGPKGPKPSDLDFTRKQMNTWNINDEWYNSLSHKKKEDFGRKELERVQEYISERVLNNLQTLFDWKLAIIRICKIYIYFHRSKQHNQKRLALFSFILVL